LFLSSLLRSPPSSTLFHYTTLFRSLISIGVAVTVAVKTQLSDPWTGACLETCELHICVQSSEVLGSSKPTKRFFFTSRLNQPLRSEEHTSELQSRENLVCRLLLEKK